MIRVNGLTKIFGQDTQRVLSLLSEGSDKARIARKTGSVIGVNKASFELDPGEVFCIMGLSGSGKSTLIRCINRLIEPSSGSVFLDDPEFGSQDITAMGHQELLRLRMTHMSMVFQHFALFPHRSVLANATYGLEIQGREKSERERIGQEVLEQVGLAEWGHVYPGQLSGGMQQRVGLARALATSARVMLMDEPFSALDPLIKVNMQQMLMDIQRDLHRTILFITHDLDEAMRIGDRIAIMHEGEIVQLGAPEDILINPRTEYVADFVEHADPTNVIRAETIALPFDSDGFERSNAGDGCTRHVARERPGIAYEIDRDRKLRSVVLESGGAVIRDLAEVSDAHGGSAREAVVYRCRRDTVLRDVLRTRMHTDLPAVAVDQDGRAIGVIDEPQLLRAILDKQGH